MSGYLLSSRKPDFVCGPVRSRAVADVSGAHAPPPICAARPALNGRRCHFWYLYSSSALLLSPILYGGIRPPIRGVSVRAGAACRHIRPADGASGRRGAVCRSGHFRKAQDLRGHGHICARLPAPAMKEIPNSLVLARGDACSDLVGTSLRRTGNSIRTSRIRAPGLRSCWRVFSCCQTTPPVGFSSATLPEHALFRRVRPFFRGDPGRLAGRATQPLATFHHVPPPLDTSRSDPTTRPPPFAPSTFLRGAASRARPRRRGSPARS